MSETLERWGSKRAFILAVTGAAVGLGNIWRFPYVAGENGGAAFLLIYVAFVLLLGIPVMMAEILIGRAGRRGPMQALAALAAEAGASPTGVGWDCSGHSPYSASYRSTRWCRAGRLSFWWPL